MNLIFIEIILAHDEALKVFSYFAPVLSLTSDNLKWTVKLGVGVIT